MKKTIIIVCIIILATNLLQAKYYYVAKNGKDSNTGTKENPYLTIQKAVDKLKAGDTCIIRRGNYHETVKLPRSGKKGKPITIMAMPGEIVTLDGTEKITTRWEKHKGSIYKTKMNKAYHQIFVDGKMMIEARWPNQPFEKRWDKSTWATADKGSSYGVLVDASLAETGLDWTGAIGTLNVGSFQTYIRYVANHKKGSDRFEYPRDISERLALQRKPWGEFDHYFLWGKLQALDYPTECFIDHKSNNLYLWTPDSKAPSTHEVRGKTINYAFLSYNQNYIVFSGLHFFAATFQIINGNNCIVNNCHFLYPTHLYRRDKNKTRKTYSRRGRSHKGESYKYFGKDHTMSFTMIYGDKNTIKNSSVAFCDGPAIYVSGDQNLIENNLFHDIDLRGIGKGLGVATSGKSVTYRRNTIFNIGSSEGIQLPGQGPNLVEYNYIHHAGLVQSDGGLIQCSSINQKGTIIRFNWVHDHIAFNWGGIGIRGDDLTRELTVHHNVAWNCRVKGIITKGDRNHVYNNTCFNNPIADIVIPCRPEPYKEWNPRQWAHLIKDQNKRTKIMNNIAGEISGRFDWELKKGLPKTVAGPMKNNFTNVKSIKSLLKDPYNYDFRPKKSSHVIDAGILIKGINDGYSGDAPDIGAYEFGGERWIPGYHNSICVLPFNKNDNEMELKVYLYMPTTEKISFIVKPGKKDGKTSVKKVTFMPDNWMIPQIVHLKNSDSIQFINEKYGLNQVLLLKTVDSSTGTKISFRTIP